MTQNTNEQDIIRLVGADNWNQVVRMFLGLSLDQIKKKLNRENCEALAQMIYNELR